MKKLFFYIVTSIARSVQNVDFKSSKEIMGKTIYPAAKWNRLLKVAAKPVKSLIRQ